MAVFYLSVVNIVEQIKNRYCFFFKIYVLKFKSSLNPMKIYIDDLHKIMPGNAFFLDPKEKALKNLSYFLDVVKTDTKLALFHFF